MKKAVTIFFCLQILTGNAFAMEVFKLPSLFQHYFEHEVKEHPGITFAAFLSEHYLSDHTDEAEGHCNEKLPFKHCSDCCSHTASISSFVLPDALSSFDASYSEFAYHCTAVINVPVGYLDCIWQPPKTA